MTPSKPSDFPTLIAIAGASGSGKTTLSRALIATLGTENTEYITLDDYYHDLSHLSTNARAQTNFDHPEAIEAGRLAENIIQLKAGHPAQTPIYNFNTHTRNPQTRLIEPRSYILIEGIFTLYYEVIRSLADIKIYVNCPEPLCLQRRLERDVKERGRTKESVMRQYTKTVYPAYTNCIAPSRRFADFVIEGTSSATVSAQLIHDTIRKRRPG